MISIKQHEIASAVPGFFLWDAETLWSRPTSRVSVQDETVDGLKEVTASLAIDEEFLDRYAAGDLEIPGLPHLANQIRQELQQGSGVVWLQNCTGTEFTEHQLRFFYLAIGTAMGQTMGNYGRLYDVRDYGGSYKTERIPVSQTRAATGFHTDSSARNTMPDIVALLCLEPAQTGGESLVVSGATIHEELRRTNMPVLTSLYREFIRDIVTPGTEKTQDALMDNRFPVFSQGLYSSELSFRYMRFWIEKGHREAKMDLTQADVEALDVLDGLLESPQFAVRFRLEAGDQLWVNNHIVAHNRTEYEEDPERPRHFVRMWIST